MHGWIGIDPGATGAIAIIMENGEIQILDYPGDETTTMRILEAIHLELDVKQVAIEYQQAMPKQGTVSMFKLGRNYGGWLMALAAIRWPTLIVRPSDWKKGLGYPAGDYQASKAHSLTMARQRYPQAAKFLLRKKDNGRAEALLLAQIAKEKSNV
jgi:hypothetical protein